MVRERINPNIRYYLPGDPYYYKVDNLPLEDLQANDASLQSQIDILNTRIDVALSSPSKHGFKELLPYWSKKQDGVLRVESGNFISRVNTKATFENGLMERLWGSDADSNSVLLKGHQSEDEPRTLSAQRDGNEQFEAKSAARTAVINYKDLDTIAVPEFNDDDFTDSDAPDFRIDLLYIQASPSMDESNEFVPRFGNVEENPRLGYVKGAYFRAENNSGGESNPRTEGEILNDKGLEGKLLGLSQVDVYGRESGTIPAPDDIVNGSWKSPSTATGAIAHTPGITPLSLDVWAENQFDNLGVFCLPVAYIKVPRGYLAGNVLSEDSIIDIRPLFRSTELTLSERQALATSHAPSLNNRFMTLNDPEYLHFKDDVVKGVGARPFLDHEGRIATLEAKMRENADIEVFQPFNLACMDGQEVKPFYLDPDETDELKLDGSLDFVLDDGLVLPDSHLRRNDETYKKTIRAIRYKVGTNQWMLYTTLHFHIADESLTNRSSSYSTATETREGNESNNPSLPMPSGYYRLNITDLGYTGGPVEAIIATPNMEMKWGGDAWTYDIFRNDAYIDEESGSYESGFIDFDFGCTDTVKRVKVRDYPWYAFWRPNDKYANVTATEGSMMCSLTLVGLSVTPDLYEGVEVATDTIY